MTEESPPEPRRASPPPRNFRQWVGDMPRWKKIAVIVAGGVLATGAVLMVVGPGAGEAATPAGGGSGSGGLLQSTLQPDQPGGGTGTGNATGGEPAAKGIFRLGFSFLAGFALGSFVRATLRFAAIAVGFWLAMTLVLSYYGLVEVNWQGIDDAWNHFMTNLESEWSSFQTFVTGSLPAAALVATGFFVGVKRH
ncbi:MAG: FUN14 domain-containing protein [Planctomycetes bacterium]|nr:FUN14 domain-containing protein [Planctomycetota bacterium]